MFIRVTFLMALSLPAWALQPASDAPAAAEPPVTTHIFEPEDVDGRTQRPDEGLETARVRRPLPSLVRVRADFDRELLSSAEDL